MKNEFELTVKTHRNIQCVMATELYAKLEIKSHFHDWFKRMCAYGFIENEDYKRVTQKKVTLGGEQKITDYFVSIDMAKQICMLQRNKKGMMYRRYLLEIEKLFKEQQSIEYKEIRKKSIEVRNVFTSDLKEHGIKKQYEFINITNAMKKPCGITHRKNEMDKKELKTITAYEALSSLLLDNEQGYYKVKPVCVKASEKIAEAVAEKKAMLTA